MTDDMRFEVDGPDVAKGLSNFSSHLADLGETEAAAAKDMAVAVRPLIPRRSGRLAGGLQVVGNEVKVSGVRYAGPIEFGVGPRAGLMGPHNITPAHFMERGAELAASGVGRLFQNELDDELSTIGKVL